ncbi:hypothetical protein GSU75_04654 [Pseudomonas savastanoi pv. phaseolicola]|nr:hypothetical protein [Pseudomonas savastanoi pv. phaseolicola]MBN4183595.1 hypothetical protein [Pseudomonas savastanoi pv. phaseolicola]
MQTIKRRHKERSHEFRTWWQPRFHPACACQDVTPGKIKARPLQQGPGFLSSAEAYCARVEPMVGSWKTRVSASLNTSLTSLVLVSWFGAMPKR